MGRLIAALVIGLILLALILFGLSKLSDRFEGKAQGVAGLAVVIAIGALAWGIVGEGLLAGLFGE